MLLSRGLYEVALLLIVLVQAVVTHLRELKPSSSSSAPLSDDQALLVKAFESRLLNIFGLDSRPRPKKPAKIPEYMMELYEQHVGPLAMTTTDRRARGSSQRPSPSSRRIRPVWSNTVRSHVHKEAGDEQQYGPNRVRLRFHNVSFPEEEVLREAELRVFVRPAGSSADRNETCRRTSGGRGRGQQCLTARRLRVQVYDILRPATRNRTAILRLVDTRTVRVPSGKSGVWESFDVLPAVGRWRNRPEANYGLYVQVTDKDGRETNKGEEHVRLKRSARESGDSERWLREQPLLVTFSDDERQSAAWKVPAERSRRTPRRHRAGKGRSKENCKRHLMYVDFNDVGWSDWIVAPPGYQAYYCQGLCPFPLPDHLNATNHAIVQTLVHSVNPKAVPPVCCVPTELSPISLLYVDAYEKVVLKNYQDMVVEGCGCR